MPHKMILALIIAFWAPTQSLALEREWNLDITENEAFLIYGSPIANDIGLGFWCLKNNPENFVFIPLRNSLLPPGKKLTAKLTLGDKITKINGRISLDIASGQTTFEAQLNRNSNLWKKLKTAEVMSLNIFNHEVTLPVNDADFASLDAACT